jgi:hypothetical protein
MSSMTEDEIGDLIAQHMRASDATIERAGGVIAVTGINDAARAIAERIGEELAEARATDEVFDMRWNADMRAIKMWQANSGRDLTWPDHADLCVWLLEQNDLLQARIDVLEGRTK